MTSSGSGLPLSAAAMAVLGELDAREGQPRRSGDAEGDGLAWAVDAVAGVVAGVERTEKQDADEHQRESDGLLHGGGACG